MSDLRVILKEMPEFIEVVNKNVIPAIPELPEYNSENDNTEKWKDISGVRKGYLLCLASFGVEI